MNDKYSQFFEHLSFLGYDVTKEDDEWKAVGSATPNTILVREVSGGLHFLVAYTNEDVKLTPDSINEINQGTWVSKFVLIDNDTITIEAWYPASYDRRSFGSFFDTLKLEIVGGLSRNFRPVEGTKNQSENE